MAKDPNSKTAQKARSAAAKRGVATKAYNRDAAAATVQREQHAESNPERFEDVFDRLGVSHWRGRVSTQHMYNLMGYRGAESPHPMGQMELPGMEQRPDAVPTPKRWEEYTEEQQAAVRKAAGRFGVTEDSARASLGAQIDHANVREDGVHHSFYSAEGTSKTGANLPRTQLKESAKSNDVSFGVQAMANAMTSPNNRFVARSKDGDVRYPNDEAASFAIRWAKEGKAGYQYEKHPNFYVPPEDKVRPANGGKPVKRKDETRKYPVQGYPSNMSKTIEAVRDIDKGASVQEAWGMTEAKSTGRSDYGDPKTAPFHNSWVDPHGSSQFWVSDTHSGPAAFAPHLKGRQETDYMGIDGIHAFHDHVARQAMAERGLQSLSGTQSQHWSEEKQRSGTAADVADMTPATTQTHTEMPTSGTATYGEYEKQADGTRKQVGKRTVEFDQGSMF